MDKDNNDKWNTSVYEIQKFDFNIWERHQKLFDDFISKAVDVLSTLNIFSFACVAEKG